MVDGGEFVTEVVEGVRLAVCGGGEGGAASCDQVLLAAAGVGQDGAEVVDLVAQGRDQGEGAGEGFAWCGSPPRAGDGIGAEQAGCFGVVVSCLLDVDDEMSGRVGQCEPPTVVVESAGLPGGRLVAVVSRAWPTWAIGPVWLGSAMTGEGGHDAVDELAD